METIFKAAIRYKGNLYIGNRHCYIGIDMVEKGICPAPYPCDKDQGFVTSDGRYVDRIEGLAIAKAAGQIAFKHGNPDRLYSEDLWNVDGSPYTEAQIAAITAKNKDQW